MTTLHNSIIFTQLHTLGKYYVVVSKIKFSMNSYLTIDTRHKLCLVSMILPIIEIQWNPSKMDTIGELRFVLYKEESLIQRFLNACLGPRVMSIVYNFGVSVPPITRAGTKQLNHNIIFMLLHPLNCNTYTFIIILISHFC